MKEVEAKKQKLLLEYLLSSVDTFALCKSIINADYFYPEYRKSVEFLINYYDNYAALPALEQVEAETGIELELKTITKDQIKYTTDELESFCRRKALEHAILASPALIEKGDYGKVEQLVKEAISVSLQRDLGLDYFADPLSRLEQQASQPLRTPMGFNAIDELMGGGLARTEIILYCANSGGGKSITLANLAYNFIQNGLNVLYLTLELSQDLVAQRFDIMFTGIPSVSVQKEYQKIAQEVVFASKGLANLTIKRMPAGTNANAIRAYLKEYELQHNIVPDLLILDYLDIMGTNEYVPAGEIWEKDKRATEQLKDIGEDFNMFIATASQLNRSAIDAEELNQGHTAGGISKVNTVDWQWAIQWTPTMRSSGEIMFICLKARSSDAVGKQALQGWSNKYLRITNILPEEDGNSIKQAIERKSFKGLPGQSKTSILDIMDI